MLGVDSACLTDLVVCWGLRLGVVVLGVSLAALEIGVDVLGVFGGAWLSDNELSSAESLVARGGFRIDLRTGVGAADFLIV